MLEAVKNFARMTTRPIGERGLFQTARSAVHVAFAHRQDRLDAFDERHGTDTARRVTLDDLSATGDDAMPLWRYAPTLVSPFRRMVAQLPVLEERLLFVDLGSGKGRALMLASEYPFRRIIGVELSPKLHAIARQNLHAFRSEDQRCFEFELFCMDAGIYAPPLEPVVLFMAQPFPVEVLDAVLERVEASVREVPRRIYIAYMNPLFDRTIMATGGYERWKSGRPEALGEFDWTNYRHL
jgi:SAM-dependent methyltransferase